MRVDATEVIRGEAIRNLLSAHKRIAEQGGAKSLIVLSKFILKMSKQLEGKLLELRTEERGVSMEIKEAKTCELVKELKNREGVQAEYAEPHRDKVISVNGPAHILIVID